MKTRRALPKIAIRRNKVVVLFRGRKVFEHASMEAVRQYLDGWHSAEAENAQRLA